MSGPPPPMRAPRRNGSPSPSRLPSYGGKPPGLAPPSPVTGHQLLDRPRALGEARRAIRETLVLRRDAFGRGRPVQRTRGCGRIRRGVDRTESGLQRLHLLLEAQEAEFE